MNEQEVRGSVEELLKSVVGPDMKVEFSDDFSLDNIDLEDFSKAVGVVTNRIRSRWLGWFWRWWYRPRRIG